MASVADDVARRLGLESPAEVVSEHRTTLAVVSASLLALIVRVVELGVRTFHWDEGRVGYWILRYRATGEFFYRPIIHGPFLPVVNNYTFAILPPTDFSARLPVALVGGLLPLAAWLLRDRLSPAETAGVALFLAVDPLLVYYSRFMRSDVLVGGFAFVAFAGVVRTWETRHPRTLYLSAAALALAFTAKENALVYLLCFLGAGALLVDHRVVRGVAAGASVRSTLRGLAGGAVRTAREASGETGTLRWSLGHALGLAATFLLVVVFFYAPRPDLWEAFANPSTAPAVLEAATLGAAERFFDLWVSGAGGDHDYLPFLSDFLETLVYGSGVTAVFAVAGFVADGYGGRPRAVVAVPVYWAAVSLLGYPVATDIQAPWAVVHVTLPLAVPAGVGLAAFARSARRSLDAGDAVAVGLAALLLSTAALGVAGANATYWNAADREHAEILQWAQPGNDLKDTLADVERVSRESRGTDVLFFGTTEPRSGNVVLYVENESSADRPPAGGPGWYSRLPLPWYLEAFGANVSSTPPGTDPATVAERAPPVVVAFPWNRSDLAEHLVGYAVREHDFKLWGEEIVIFIDRDALARSRE